MSSIPSVQPPDPAVPAGTEEEVKNNVILPWLRRIGIDPAETSFEQTFTVQLGHNQIVVGKKKRKTGNLVGGRYDTLVKRNGQNLLIVEFKAGGLPLDDTDRDQAISYARLLKQIAPYALVTNGRDHQLFDVETTTKCDAIKIKDRYHLSLSDDLIAQAQELFLNLSLENLMAFCHEQVEAQLKPLTGSPTDIAKKYVPQLTVPRVVIDEWITNWEGATEPGLLLLAESGRGKTSALCDLAKRRLARDKPTIFFAAGALEGSLLGAIANEFNWVFTEQVSAVNLMKRLNRITSGKGFLIIVDAIDEWLYPQRAASLLTFLRGVRDLEIRILFSCKTNAWPSFCAPAGQDLGINAFVHRRGDPNDGDHHLPPLNDAEFFDAVRRYGRAFNVRGMFESAALSEARRNPFILRVLFSVAATNSADFLSFSLKDFFSRYYEFIVQNTGHRDVADAQLVALARSYEDSNQPTLTMDELRATLALPINDTLLPALFEQDVLQRTPNGIAFYFQHLRDYLIAFRVRNWPRLSPEDFAGMKVQGITAEAFNFYLRYASADQMRALCGPAYSTAEKYVALYEELLGKHFPQLRVEFEPREKGLVGFIAEYVTSSHGIGGYGFRVREPGDPAVLIVPVDEFFSKSNLLAIHGAKSLFYSGSAHGLMMADVPHEVVENEICRQMKSILEEKRLLMRTAMVVPKEAIVAAVEQSPSYFANLYDSDGRQIQYPLTAAKFRTSFERVKLANHFRSEIAQEKAALAGTPNRWSSLGPDDEPEVLRRVETALAGKLTTKLCSIDTDVRELEGFLERVGSFNVQGEIAGRVWPTNFELTELLRTNADEGQRRLEDFVSNFFRAFLADYCAIIEENFPSLKTAFQLYAKMPVRLHVAVKPHLDGYQITGHVSTVGTQLPAGSRNEVIVCRPDELETIRATIAARGDYLFGGGELLQLIVATGKGSTPLQDRIYRCVSREWPAAVDVIRREAGFSN
jgi:hypothetical protein